MSFFPDKPLSEYKYHPVETGVGCAEHGDPTCLCDVVVTDPVPILKCLDYEFGNVSTETPGSLPWIQNLLAIHDALAVCQAIRTDRYSLMLYGVTYQNPDLDLWQFILDVQDSSLKAEIVEARHGIGVQTVRRWRREFSVPFTRKARRARLAA